MHLVLVGLPEGTLRSRNLLKNTDIDDGYVVLDTIKEEEVEEENIPRMALS